MILCGCTTEVHRIVARSGCRHPLPDRNQAEGVEGWSGLRIVEELTYQLMIEPRYGGVTV